jgi:hypothetical protein
MCLRPLIQFLNGKKLGTPSKDLTKAQVAENE